MKKTVGSLLVAALLLTGCGSNSSNSGLKVYHDYETQSREVTSFNYLSDFQATNAQVYANFVSIFSYDSFALCDCVFGLYLY